jgi:hypothetical protein
MLGGYAARDHYGIDQAKDGLNHGSRTGRQERRNGVHGNPHPTLFSAPLSRKGCACHVFSFRKEVIQPQVLLRLPCYDFTPIMNYTLDGCPLAVGSPASSATHFRDVTGGVYKARERIHRGVLIRDY